MRVAVAAAALCGLMMTCSVGQVSDAEPRTCCEEQFFGRVGIIPASLCCGKVRFVLCLSGPRRHWCRGKLPRLSPSIPFPQFEPRVPCVWRRVA